MRGHRRTKSECVNAHFPSPPDYEKRDMAKFRKKRDTNKGDTLSISISNNNIKERFQKKFSHRRSHSDGSNITKLLQKMHVSDPVYEENQWSPNNPDGKKCYGRQFLLARQYIKFCVTRPQGLPDLPEILDKPHIFNKRYRTKSTRAQNGNIDDDGNQYKIGTTFCISSEDVRSEMSSHDLSSRSQSETSLSSLPEKTEKTNTKKMKETPHNRMRRRRSSEDATEDSKELGRKDRRTKSENADSPTGSENEVTTSKRRRRRKKKDSESRENGASADSSPSRNSTSDQVTCTAQDEDPIILSRHGFISNTLCSSVRDPTRPTKPVGKVLRTLIQTGAIPVHKFLQGLEMAIETVQKSGGWEEPSACPTLGNLLGYLVHDNTLPLASLKQSLAGFGCSERSGVIMLHVMHRVGIIKAEEVWRESGLSWSDYLPPGGDIVHIARDQNLQFIPEEDHLQNGLKKTVTQDSKNASHSPR